MESKRERTTRRTSFFQRYLIPITIVSSVVVSGTVGYFVSHFNTKESFAQAEMQSRVDDMQEESVTIIEKEIPQIIEDLDEYDQDLAQLVQQVDLLNQNMVPVRKGLDYINGATLVISGVNIVVSNPMLGKMSSSLSSANCILQYKCAQ